MPDFEIEGNPGNVRSRALTMEQKGQLFYDTGDALAKIDVSGWTGRAADEFREAHDLEPDRWVKAGNGFKKAAAGLRTYAGALEDAQSRAEWARKEYERGQRESESARTQYDSYMGRMQAYWSSGGTDPAEPFNDWGDPIQKGALAELAAARADLDNAAHVCAGEVRAGCADAPEEPSWWESGLKFVGGILEGAGEAVWDLLTMVPFSPVNMVMDSYKLATGDITPEELMKKYELSAENAWEMAKGIYTGLTTDPIGFGKELGKALLDWDTWADDPARAIGHLVPDAIIAVATAGTGALATRGARGGLDAIDALGDLNRLDNLADLGKLDRFDELTGLRRLDDLPEDLRGLVNKPIDELSPGELQRLVEARDAIRVEPGTPMQRVIPQSTVDDYLRGSSDTNPYFKSDQTFGFTSRAEDVDQLHTPREMHDKLGLDYKDSPFSPDDSDIHVLRYDQTDPSGLDVPRHSDLGGNGNYDKDALDPDNPFTGNGYTSGGIPEFRTDTPTTMPEGSQIWRMDSSGGQELVAVLTDYMGTKMWMPVQ
ncbi:putative T7SS-secreted protein [Nocardioides sp.]|uniref:putative T7SS-secreted protein n=1 Tax=Nocardioides sp. TaxID=35761 RepID=UPI0035AFDE8F